MNYLEPLGGVEFRTFPGNQLLQPPAGASDYPPVVTASGEALWRTVGGGLLRSDGTTLIPERSGLHVGWRVIGDLTPDKGSFLMSVDVTSHDTYNHGLEVYDMAGNVAAFRKLYAGAQLVVPGWWSPKEMLAVVTIDVPPPPEYLGVPVPALLNLNTGEYGLLTDPFVTAERPYQPYGRSRVDAVQLGPFVRVTGTNSCLNVRAEPSITGQVLACMADGVLLTDSGESQTIDGVTWVRVTTPAHIQGWAAATYLER
jgi:hypothetical protein